MRLLGTQTPNLKRLPCNSSPNDLRSPLPPTTPQILCTSSGAAMVELGGMLAAGILKVVANQIGSAIGGQIKLQKNFDKELKKMKMALESVDALLEDAGRRSVTDKSTLLWLKRLKDAMYAISDMIDEFEADTVAVSWSSARRYSFKNYLAIMTHCLTIGPKITMANKMEKMRDGLEVITDQHKKFKLMEGTNANEVKVTDIRETSSTMETQIIGRTEEKDEILLSLFESMTEDVTILPIYGIGGLGKTTLAKMVYNSSQFKGYSRVWVYVSQIFDLKKIGNSIISQLSEEEKESEYTAMQLIHNSLQKLLADKKILIVLDDLWEGEEFHLESLMDMLRVGKGSNVTVVVTTRDESIAKKISTTQPYKLAPLTDDICWSIIKQKSAFESSGEKEELEKIGKVIAMKCGGVALAAKSLGHMLQALKPSEWEWVRDSNIWTVSSLKDTSSTQVLASLMLSYSVMPSYLKLCFAYCAIFPKGHKIVKDDLILQWVSLGFTTWQLGERYISQLLGLSFLENSYSGLITELYGEDITLLTMHDLVHDLARSVLDDEIHVVGKGGNIEGSCYRYALLNDCCKPLGLESSKIRTLRFMNCHNIKLNDDAFSSAKSLRVLDLSQCNIHKLTDCIGELKQLRYLNAPRLQDAMIPDSITKLSKLIHLNLHGSLGILKLPESFGRLKELVHLDLSNCFSTGGISVFLERLTELQYLNLSYFSNFEEMPEALGGLSKLKYLNLSFSSYITCCKEAEFLGALTRLEYLNLASEHSELKKLPEALGRFTQLKYLNLSGCYSMTELPSSLGSLKSLVHLDLSYCDHIDCLQESLVGLTSLQYLNLKDTSLRSLPADLTKLRYLNLSNLSWILKDTLESLINHISSNLSDLEHLDLSHNVVLTSIPESLCSLRKLHTLDLSQCTCVETIPESIGAIDSLKFLYLNGCHSISKPPKLCGSAVSLPYFVVQPGNCESSSNLIQLQNMDPDVLQITKLENVKSTAEAHRIKLMGKQKLYNLKLEWTGDVKRFVDDKTLLDKLVPPITLKRLEICGYNGVSFPAWLVGQLPNLERLVLRGMVDLVEWDTSYSNGDEHVLQKLEIRDCPKLRMKPSPPKAKFWMISNSDNVLSSWEEYTASHTNASSSSSPITTGLSVKYCEVPLHQWSLLQHFSGLTYLSIGNCGDLTGSPETIHHLSFMKTLCLVDIDLEKLPKWIGEITSLHDLDIRECTWLKGLNENMRQLTKLRSLQVHRCNSMASLPHWLGELTSLKQLFISSCGVLRSLPESIHQLTGLQNLKIEECRGITSLPEGIQQLPNLQLLIIRVCPKLKQWSELEENKMKLAHIKNKELLQY